MKMFLDIECKSPEVQISHDHPILLIGSCFTEHIGNRLAELKFQVLQNPNGILFDPVSVCRSLVSYTRFTEYGKDDLFFCNELWQSWKHHSRFSGVHQHEVIQAMNESQQEANAFLAKAKWIIITLGSSFSYQLAENGEPVANCHRAPAKWFRKHLLSIEETVSNLDNAIHQLFHFNQQLNIIFTVSPVRHIRDGVIENNRSKARLIESVHHLVNKFDRLHYFPAYELVIDVLRDYRFYDIDLVHPNYAATEFVFEKFRDSFITPESVLMMEEIRKFRTAFKHKPFQPSTAAHKQFMQSNLEKIQWFHQKYPQLDFSKEIGYFSGGAD